MGFKAGAYAKVWTSEDKGNYHVVDLSTSKKDKNSGNYETDFSSKFTRFIGEAHTQAKTLRDGDKIKITSCEVTSKYDKEKKTTYTNFLVFGFEDANGNGGGQSKQTDKPKPGSNDFMQVSDTDLEELPFS